MVVFCFPKILKFKSHNDITKKQKQKATKRDLGVRAYFPFYMAEKTSDIFTHTKPPIPTTHNRKLNGFLCIFFHSLWCCPACVSRDDVAGVLSLQQPPQRNGGSLYMCMYIGIVGERSALLSSHHNRQNGRCLATSNWFEYSLYTNPMRALFVRVVSAHLRATFRGVTL